MTRVKQSLYTPPPLKYSWLWIAARLALVAFVLVSCILYAIGLAWILNWWLAS